MPVMQGQCSLFDGEDVIGKEEEKIISIREHKRPGRKKGGRERLIRELPVETVECVLNPEDAVCAICGQEMKVIGQKKVRSEIEFVPAKLVVKKYIQTVYKCPECGKTEKHPDDVIRSAKIPAQVLRHSYASESLVVWIMFQKYMLSVPLYRQEKEWAGMGLKLNRATMANWLILCARYWFSHLFERLHQQLLKGQIIMSDETTWQVNHEPGKKASSKSYIWVHRSADCEGPPVILYEYTRTREGNHAKEFLSGFHGYHVSDAYAGYDKVEGIIRCLCFCHLRRYYIEAIPLDSGKKEIPGSGGAIGRQYCNDLFRLERRWKNLPPKERLKKRLLYSVPLLDAFFTWAETVITTQEPLKKALKYTLNHRESFRNLLLDGRIPLSNNLSEIAVKPVAITRKNSLFSDSIAGAETSALILSLLQTASANGLDRYRYVEYLFRKLPGLEKIDASGALEEYLPWSENAIKS